MQYSVVIPVKDEAENIPVLAQEVQQVMNTLPGPWELIYINDGSKDNSQDVLKELSQSMPELKVISFDRNYGQSSAFHAGFRAARGKYIITLDGDLQNDPKDIPQLLEAIKGHDLVCGWRQRRKDTVLKRLISKPSNIIRSRLCKDQVHDTGCSLKVFKKDALMKIKGFHGMHRFFPALFVVEGLKVTEVKVSHRARSQGKSKYHLFNRNFGPMLDMLAVYWMRKRRLQYQIDEDA